MQILLMDQDPAVRGRVADVLLARFEAAQCLEIDSAAELASALERGNIDAVLTGDRLGWAAGREIVPLVKAHCPDIPVLMVTDLNDVSYAVEALQSGLSDYVLLRDLPRLPDALLASLEQAQAQRQRAADLEQLRAAAKAHANLEIRVQERTVELAQREARLRETMETLARRETELQEALRLGEALNGIHRAINSTLDFAEIMRRVMLEATRALGCESAGVMQPQGPNWTASYVHGLPPSVVGRRYPADQVPHALRAVETGDVVAVSDMLNERPGPPRENVEAYHIRSSMAVPLLRRGEALGVLFFNYHAQVVTFSPAQIDFGRKLAAAIGLALDNARLYVELESRVRQRTVELAEAVEEGSRQAARLREQADLLNLSHDAIIARDMQAHVRFWNRGAEDRYGWSAAEAMGQRSHDLFHTQFPTSEAEVYAELLENGYWEGELVHTKRDGRQIVVAARWSLQRDAQGRPAGVLEINNDITLRREAELAVRRQAKRLQVLHEIDAAILASQSVEQIAGAAVKRVRQLITCRSASVVLFDFERGEAELLALDVDGQEDASGSHPAGRRFPLAAYPITEEHQSGKLIRLEDGQAAEAGARLAGAVEEGLGSLLMIPLLAQGHLIGDLNLASEKPGAFAADDLPVARQVGDSLAVAIQNARLHEREQSARRAAEALRSANLALTRSLEIEQVLAVLLESLSQLVPYDEAQVMLLEEKNCLTVRAARSALPAGQEIGRTQPQVYRTRSAPALRQVIDLQHSLLVADTSTFPGWSHLRGFEAVRSWLGVPLMAGGKAIGLVSISQVETGNLNIEHLRVAEGLAAQAAIAIQNAQLFAQVETGLRQQQTLAQRLVEVQEMERRAIARELHDEAGQALTSLMVNLNLLQRDADEPEVVISRAEEMKRVTGSVMDGLHRLSANLRPASLDRLGLVPALRQLVTDSRRRNGLQIEFMAVGLDDDLPLTPPEASHGERQRGGGQEPEAGGKQDAAALPGDLASHRLPAETETMLYRIVQEALTNVTRHAQAEHIGILVERRDDRVTAVIEDDGLGFDPDEARRRGRLGLLGMSERATMLGGKLTIESSPGKGTTVFVDIPVARGS